MCIHIWLVYYYRPTWAWWPWCAAFCTLWKNIILNHVENCINYQELVTKLAHFSKILDVTYKQHFNMVFQSASWQVACHPIVRRCSRQCRMFIGWTWDKPLIFFGLIRLIPGKRKVWSYSSSKNMKSEPMSSVTMSAISTKADERLESKGLDFVSYLPSALLNL